MTLSSSWELKLIHSCVENPTGIEVQVVDWNTGAREVAIHFKDLGQLLTINAEGARSLAFLLMECADFIEPPFTDGAPPENDESVAIFGPYDDECLQEDSEEFDEDEEDEDE